MAVVNMITKGRERARLKSVLLFSGGMDSVIFDKLLNPDILLYIPTGPVYEEIETQKINQLADENLLTAINWYVCQMFLILLVLNATML